MHSGLRLLPWPQAFIGRRHLAFPGPGRGAQRQDTLPGWQHLDSAPEDDRRARDQRNGQGLFPEHRNAASGAFCPRRGGPGYGARRQTAPLGSAFPAGGDQCEFRATGGRPTQGPYLRKRSGRGNPGLRYRHYRQRHSRLDQRHRPRVRKPSAVQAAVPPRRYTPGRIQSGRGWLQVRLPHRPV